MPFGRPALWLIVYILSWRLPGNLLGAVGFSLVENQAAQIRFTNSISNELLMRNYNLMQGSGVALGDFNSDGKPDLYFCAIDGSNRLYRNLGGWRFEDVTGPAGLACANWHSTGACFADLDGDGNLDLLVSTLGRGVHSFMGDGRGGFRETTSTAGLASNAGSMTMTLGDVDGDGDLDLYIANYGELSILRTSAGRVGIRKEGDKWVVTGPHARRLRFENGQLEEVGEPDILYLNDGKGRFKAVPWNSNFFVDDRGKPMEEPWDFGLSAQMRDINDDGFPDIYVCNDFKSPDRMWLNDGKGHFRLWSREAAPRESYASMGVDFADIDRDGRLDFFVVEMLTRDLERRKKQRNQVDLSGRPQLNQNSLFWNRGDGTYSETAKEAGVDASDWSWQPVFLDVDLDGYEDILVANGNLHDTQDIGTMDRIKALGRQSPEQSRSNIFLYPTFHSPNVAFRNRGNRAFEEVGRQWGFAATNISQGIALADVDGDADLDVVINCLNSGPLLYRNEAAAGKILVKLRGKAPNTQGIGAKVIVSGPGLPIQKQEIVCGGRYLSGDDPARMFAANGPVTIEVVWRSGTKSTVRNADPNRRHIIDEPSP